ncbi:tumor susceptibility gene 101 protein-like isoform X1 [Crassostrea angulata]|uniref:tumor susceptibility gene 101 protein-like isoform X1 n=1 Tax=Magallana angulata TaxID=2784310 RepID=UPI0022B0B99D|nr:tumor susceptibility gene 101 protein-like isoform X1 [Crassostrea angulata]
MASADQILRQALSKYRYADISRRDVTNAMTHFKDLRPDHDLFIFNDGNRKELLHLDGTIPVTYKGSIYNIPICVWIMDTHPYKPPMVFVKPTSTMQIKTGRHVDSNGKVDLPYLHDWRFPQSDLLGLIQILAIVFGEEPPVYSKQSQMTQSSSPNSYPGTGKYPGVSRQCIDPETTFNPFAAQAPIHGQGYNLEIFFQTMERFELDDIMNTLIEHGVDCVETFCSMTESDFKEMGLNIGQRRKCILAAEHIKNYGLNG